MQESGFDLTKKRKAELGPHGYWMHMVELELGQMEVAAADAIVAAA